MRSDKLIPVFDKMKQSPSFFAVKQLDEQDIKDLTNFYEFLIKFQSEKSYKSYLDKLQD